MTFHAWKLFGVICFASLAISPVQRTQAAQPAVKDSAGLIIPAEFKTTQLTEVIRHFEKLNEFPRPSHGEKMVRDYLRSLAKSKGYNSKVDEHGNLTVFMPARGDFARLGEKYVGVQAHMDMVWDVKDLQSGQNINLFFENGVPLEIKGKYLQTKENKTTNGADNGFGVAMMMRLMMAGPESLPPLMLIFTADEEDTTVPALKYAEKIPTGYLVNLDGMFSNEILIGCQGTRMLSAERPLQMTATSPQGKIAQTYIFSGLVGGHSGKDIRKNQGHAVQLMADFLNLLKQKRVAFDVLALGAGKPPVGGKKIFNKIPRDFEVSLLLSKPDAEKAKAARVQFMKTFTKKYAKIEDNKAVQFKIREQTFEKTEASNLVTIPQTEVNALLNLIEKIPSGVFRKSGKLFQRVNKAIEEKDVETSSNFSFLFTQENPDKTFSVHAGTMPRSFSNAIMDEFVESHKRALEQAGWSRDPAAQQMTLLANDPAWEPRKGTLATLAQKVKTGNPEPQKTLGFIEAPYFIASGVAREVISIGPTIEFPHTADERLDLSTANEPIEFLDRLLAELAKSL